MRWSSFCHSGHKLAELEAHFSSLVVAHVQGPAQLADCARGEAHLLHLFFIFLHNPLGSETVSRLPPTPHVLLLFFSATALRLAKVAALLPCSWNVILHQTGESRPQFRNLVCSQRQLFHLLLYLSDDLFLLPKGDYPVPALFTLPLLSSQ